MPFYHKLGNVPHKRHVQFRKQNNELYHEEVMGLRGFDGMQSILYHCSSPTAVRSTKLLSNDQLELDTETPLEQSHLKTADFRSKGDPIESRVWLMANADAKVGLATPTESMDYFYRNGLCDELLYVHWGAGFLRSQFGRLSYRQGDYIVVPVGTTYQVDVSEETRFLVVESTHRIEIPKRYCNEYGQLLEHAPFCERDFNVPQDLETIDEKGEFETRVRLGDNYTSVVQAHHPFDVVGWDGYLFPWTFNIGDFEPITGRVHQPPPVHQTFHSAGFVVCSFVPRLFDYHPEAIPAPYYHSNVNSDEVLYYAEGNFMSRRGIDRGSFTIHKAGIPHGPHPGTIEASIGKEGTEELAVMIDTFAALHLAREAQNFSDPDYQTSWLT